MATTGDRAVFLAPLSDFSFFKVVMSAFLVNTICRATLFPTGFSIYSINLLLVKLTFHLRRKSLNDFLRFPCDAQSDGFESNLLISSRNVHVIYYERILNCNTTLSYHIKFLINFESPDELSLVLW